MERDKKWFRKPECPSDKGWDQETLTFRGRQTYGFSGWESPLYSDFRSAVTTNTPIISVPTSFACKGEEVQRGRLPGIHFELPGWHKGKW